MFALSVIYCFFELWQPFIWAGECREEEAFPTDETETEINIMFQ